MKVGVIGVGRFGKFHCQKYKGMDVDLVGIFDVDFSRCKEVSKEIGCRPYSDIDRLLEKVEAVSIATPTIFHFFYAYSALMEGVHVFVEKPITHEPEQAQLLVDLSERLRLVFQVGHIERFNGALVGAAIHAPDWIMAKRTSRAESRSDDVDVVLDLMIHDIDIALSHFGYRWKVIKAVQSGDWTKARVDFGSRNAVFHVNRKAEIDDRFMLFRKKGSRDVMVNFHAKTNDALLEELTEFVRCIRSGSRPTVQGIDGLMALKLATEIRERIENVG